MSSTQDKSKNPITVDKALDWNTTFNLTQQVKSIRFVEDGEGNIWGYPVILIDPTAPEPIQARASVVIRDATTASAWATVATANANSIYAGGNSGGLWVTNVPLIGNPIANTLEVLRTANTIKSTAIASAPGTTDVWTPAGGKKFRLMGGLISMSGLIAAAATRTMTLFEETAGTVLFRCNITIPVLGTNVAFPFNFPGNGFLASIADKKLQCTTAGGTYTAGGDSVMVWGTEE